MDSGGHRSVEIAVDLNRRVNLAAQQNSVPVVRSISLRNLGETDLTDLEVRVRTDPPVADPWIAHLEGLRAGATHVFSPVDLRLSPGFLAAQTERQAGRLEVKIAAAGEPIADSSEDIEVLAPTEWQGGQSLPELLAAWVTPNNPALVPLLKTAAERLGLETDDASLSGYQSHDPQRVALVVQSLYLAVQAAGVTYINPPASFETLGQKIRMPDQVLDGGLGTCIDLTVLLASLIEQAGLKPLLVLVDGHAFPGVWLIEQGFHGPTLGEVVPLRNRIRLGEIMVFDSSAMAQDVSFEQARRSAEKHLIEDDAFRFVVDVAAARRELIRPLSIPGIGAAQAEPAPEEVDRSQNRLEPVALRGKPEAEQRTTRTSRTRLDRWKARLLDLTLRNRLLNFKETKRTVRLLVADLPTLEDSLADDQTFALFSKPATPGAQDPRSPGLLEAREGEDPEALFLREAQRNSVLHTAETESETNRRLLELYRQAKTAFDESGAITLYLAVGMLRWYESETSELPRLAPLILVPVSLERGRGSEPFRLRMAEDETRVNSTLLRKLEQDYGLDAAGLETLPTDDSGVDVPLILQRFGRMVLAKTRWEVLDECFLAQFSFTKFLMWLDLEAHTEQLLDNPVVRHIFEGRGEPFAWAESPLSDADLDELDPSGVFTVVEADPSQLKAVMAAAQGSSFVLQGPPGTGKSQTISNLVAQVLGEGRTVLFVSEKMAALDVVHRRLSAVGLAPFCLELHSHKANKRAVVDQLAATFDAPKGDASEEWHRQGSQLDDSRHRLNLVAEALGRPGPFGLSPFALCSRLIGLRDAPAIDLDFGDINGWDPARFRGALEGAERLANAVAGVGGVDHHPFSASRLADWTPILHREIERSLAELVAAASAAQSAVSEAASALSISCPGLGHSRTAAFAELAILLARSPSPPLELVLGGGFAARKEEATGWLELAERRRDRWSGLRGRWQEGLLNLGLDALRRRLSKWANSFVVIAFFALWGTRRTLKTVSVSGRLPPRRDTLEDVVGALEVAELDARMERIRSEARHTLGPIWRDAETDTEKAGALLAWAESFRKRSLVFGAGADDPSLQERLARMACETPELVAAETEAGRALESLGPRWSEYLTARRTVVELLLVDEGAAWASDAGPEGVGAAAGTWLAEAAKLRDWSAVVRATGQLDKAGLSPLVGRVLSGDLSAEDVQPALKRALFRWAWETLSAASPPLAQFRGADHEQVIERFRKLDEERLGLAQTAVGAALAKRIPDLHAPGDEMALLRRQFKLQRRHAPIRQLFARIPGTLRRLKPCVLMSPLSVAQYLDPSLERFDLVVFDEASQIPPWDAIGAIARGNQVVVVGDSKQLPPTSFFERGSSDEDEVDDEDLEETESILDEAVSSGLPQLSLRWHYRSRHESLITFSNYLYYGNGLHTFPAARQHVAGMGVQLRPVPEGVYDRGKSRTNQAEAEAVVAELLGLLRAPAHRRKSVGIVTFSMPQQRLIEDLVDAERLNDKSLEEHFGEEVEQAVFIKNLENVQGDERDVMLFSICYGPDRTGRVAMNFGALNREGGERRLNVAVTRARERTVVFSTLRADQIDLSRTRAIGVRHLKMYLDYADRGVVALDGATVTEADREPESPFEEEVKERLEAAGWTVHAQVGCSGYRIDLAVVEPEHPGAYLLGIECDGATYHSSRNARERDRLRQMVLEGLGWKIHRIWSTDWWLDRDGEIERLERALEAAAVSRKEELVDPAPPLEPDDLPADAGSSDTEPLPSARERLAERLDAAPRTRSLPAGTHVYPVVPVVAIGSNDAFYLPEARRLLASRLAEIVGRQGPIHVDEADRAVAACWGLSRLGRRIRDQVEAALRSLRPEERPLRIGDYYWQTTRLPESWRDFRVPSDDPKTVRDIHLIAPEELANAAAWVLEQATSISREDLQRETAALFGVGQLRNRVRTATDGAIGLLAANGRAEVVGDRVRLRS